MENDISSQEGTWCDIWTEEGRQGDLVVERGSTGKYKEEGVGEKELGQSERDEESRQEYKEWRRKAKREVHTNTIAKPHLPPAQKG